MAITSATNKIKLPQIIGNNICQKQNKNIRVHKMAGLTNTLTPFVLEMLGVNIFLRPGRSHVRNWQKPVYNQKQVLFLRKYK